MTSRISLSRTRERSCRSRYVFGPVPSRRLGASLGVDCIPFKTCNYDCIYCELGKAKETINTVAEYSPVSDILKEIDLKLSNFLRPDHITIAGSGEPTLHSGIGEIIAGIKKLTDIPVVLLTNGSLFFRKDIREAACNADIVIPSLDAGNERTFAAVNRPHPEISFQSMVDGICRFREEFRGNLWLEILFIEGFNTKDSELTALKSYADRIAPEIIHLNTIDRYPAELYAKKVRIDIMNEIATFFGENAQII